MSEERVQLTLEQLDAMMPEGDKVHTFIQSRTGILFGADWDRSDLLKEAERGAELSGESATKMGHGAVVWREDGTPVFVETK